MKSFVYHLSLGILMFVSVQCRNASEILPIPTTNVDMTENKECKASDYFATPEVIALETCNHSLISHIDRLIRITNKIYILDKTSKQIFTFDHTGKFINSINRGGRGPANIFKSGILESTP